jgi:hypothetical protein
VRLRALLDKNREEGLGAREEKELNGYIAEIDYALENTSDQLLMLAEQRRHTKTTNAQ